MADRPGESADERADRNYGDILQETRVLQTGVQVLFAFLLTVPFQGRFDALDDYQRGAYLVCLAASATAALTLIAPVAAHRLLFGRGVKPSLVRIAHVTLTGGTGLFGVAVTSGLVLVVDIVVGRVWGAVAGAAAAALALVLWVVAPRRLRG